MSQTPPKLLAYLLVNAATLLWAGNVVLGRALRADIGPWTLAGLRAAVASVLFATLLAAGRGAARAWGRREGALLLGMALTGVVGFQVLLYTGLRHTTAINAGLVNATGPLATLLLSRLFLATPLSGRQILGAAVTLVGVGAILTGGSWAALRGLRLGHGDLLVLAAVGLWAAYSVAGRVLLKAHATVWVTAWSTMAALPFLVFPAAREFAAAPPAVQWPLVAAVLYIGIGPSFLAFLSWNEGVRRLGPNGAMAFYNTLPLYAALFSALALGEWPGPAQLVGGALIVGGCLVAARP